MKTLINVRGIYPSQPEPTEPIADSYYQRE